MAIPATRFFAMTDPIAPPPRPPKRPSHVKQDGIVLLVLLLLIVFGVPTVMVAVGGARLDRVFRPRFASTEAKTRIAEVSREFALPKDASITPQQAGAAFHAISPVDSAKSKFSFVPKAPRPVDPWREDSLPPELFPTAHSQLFTGPDPNRILKLASAGLKRDEVEYLERVAHAPVWHDVDIVARAPSVDILGGRLMLPFPDTAASFDMPIIKFGATRSVAYAGASRAAYYLVRNQRDSAELALRSIISLGFALSDNGTTAIDHLIGVVIVGIGRGGLIQLYNLTNDPRGKALQARTDSVIALVEKNKAKAETGDLASTIATLKDEHVARGYRFELLHLISVSPCTNVRELLFGPRKEIVEAFAWARQHLARTPAEVAQVDLSERSLAHDFSIDAEQGPGQGLAKAIASLASTLTGNPRLSACTSLMAAGLQ